MATGLSLIWMVLSSWLFVLGRLKLFFFRWRREQHEPSPCGDDETDEAREPALLIIEISMQFVWKVCSSTNSWFCSQVRGGSGGREGWREEGRDDMLLMNHSITAPTASAEQ